jgi:hypothetical protein
VAIRRRCREDGDDERAAPRAGSPSEAHDAEEAKGRAGHEARKLFFRFIRYPAFSAMPLYAVADRPRLRRR